MTPGDLGGQNGEVISRAPMPDGEETYMSVVVLPGTSPEYKNVVFGTGGETLPGNLFVCSISEIMSGSLSGAIKLDSSTTKGFVAPAAWVDINEDGIHDIVANAFDGKILAFDGMRINRIDTKFPLSDRIRWESYMGSNYNGVYNK